MFAHQGNYSQLALLSEQNAHLDGEGHGFLKEPEKNGAGLCERDAGNSWKNPWILTSELSIGASVRAADAPGTCNHPPRVGSPARRPWADLHVESNESKAVESVEEEEEESCG